MLEDNKIEYIKKCIEDLNIEILEKQEELNKLIGVLNNENDLDE